MTYLQLRELILDVPDFPEAGVIFKDITPVLINPEAFGCAVDGLAEAITRHGATEVLAIESRGFLFGAAVARVLGLPLHLVRKPGKLPRQTIGEDYALEYGIDRVEVHEDVLRTDASFAIVDDVIATGGTASATARLVRQRDARVACCSFVIELGFLRGRERLSGFPVESLITYD